MIIGLLEYGEVRIFDSIDEIMARWGSHPTDLSSQVIVFYDSDGVWLEPVVAKGPRRWFGLRDGIEAFTLRRNAAPADSVDSIGLALFEAATLVANRHFGSLDELRARFPFSDSR
jgi:hypothetical protein